MTTADAKARLKAFCRDASSNDERLDGHSNKAATMGDLRIALSALEAPHSMTEAITPETRLQVIEAVALAIKRFVATNWRWPAAEEAADAAITAMQSARPIDQQGTITAKQMRDRLLDGLNRPIAPVQDDDAELIEELRELKKGWVTSRSFSKFIDRVCDRIEYLNRLGNQSVGGEKSS